MSGVKRTEDFHSIKTRGIVVQNTNGTFPPADSVLTIIDNRGHVQASDELRVKSIVCDRITADIVGGAVPIATVSVDELTVKELNADIVNISGSIIFNKAFPVTLLNPNATSTNQLIHSYNNLLIYLGTLGLVSITTTASTRILAATADGKLIQTTSQGNFWNDVSGVSGFPAITSGIIWATSQWYAIGTTAGSSRIVYTTDSSLNQWTPAVPTTTTFDGSGADIGWNGQIFVAAFKGSTTPLWTSSDGMTWYPSINMPDIIDANRIIWNGNLWMVLGRNSSGGILYTSLDGDNWINPSNGNVPNMLTVNDAAYDGLKWIVCGSSSSGKTVQYTYADVTDWVWQDPSSGIFTNTANSIVWNGNMFVVVGRDTNLTGSTPIIYSQDGLIWQHVNPNSWIIGSNADPSLTFNIGTSVMWVINRFIAVGYRDSYTGLVVVPIYSQDGISWTLSCATTNDPAGQSFPNITTVSHNYNVWDEQAGVPDVFVC